MARVLVVDDRSVDRRMVSYMLQKQGHSVTAAADGFEALASLSAAPCDLVIADLHMPLMDGLTLFHQLRTHQQHQVPFILYSASGQDQDRIAAQAAGVSSYVSKPASSRELARLVNQLVPHADGGEAM